LNTEHKMPYKIKSRQAPKVSEGDDLPDYTDALAKNADYFIDYEPDACREIIKSKTGAASIGEATIIDAFKQAVEKKGDKLALVAAPTGEKLEIKGRTWTWQQYYDDTRTVAKAMIELGMERFSTSSVIGFNSPEWIIANAAAVFAGGKSAGIYTTNSPDAVQYIVDHSRSHVAFCENEGQLEKFREKQNDFATLKVIVMWAGTTVTDETWESGIRVISWAKLIEIGEAASDAEMESRIADIKPGHCAVLIYTSGTTGAPKAVMISHDNILFETTTVLEAVPWMGHGEEHIMSYLPLSHVAGQMVDFVMPINLSAKKSGWCTVSFATPTALKGTLGAELQAIRPTMFLGVPRVWEKIQEAILAKGKGNKGLKLAIAKWAKSKGLLRAKNNQLGGNGKNPLTVGLAEKIVFSKVKEALGLGRCTFAFTGAAPMPTPTQKYFSSLGVQINEVYGMSECTGATTWSTDETYKWGSCGYCMAGVEMKVDHIASRGDKEGEGELCYRGRNVMMGYLYNEAKTREAIDSEGWLHSGDIGRVDEDGMYFITGRIKELIVTHGGENIAPVPIEDAIKEKATALANVMMVGDKRKYNVMLVTLKSDVDGDANPLDTLAGEAVDIDPSCKTVGEAQKSEVWQKYIQASIDAYNATAVSNAQKIQYFKILDQDFSVPGTELTATLKLKRSVAAKKYADIIESMYSK